MAQAEPRVEPRTRVTVRASLRDAGPEREACILDASTRGLLATAARPPARGEFIELVVGRHVIVGQVKWASARRFGVALRERISIPALVSGDTATLGLQKTRAVQKRGNAISGAMTGLSQLVGRAAQFWVLAIAAGAAAYALSQYSGEGLDAVGEVRTAMARTSAG